MENPQIQLCLVLHNHQPVGNFDNVFEAAYQDSYLPFLDVFEPYDRIRISLHTSGPLMQWLQTNHPEYLSRVSQLVEAGRIEIVGGAFYEAILPMIPQRDRVGQIARFSDWLKERLCSEVRGMWMPERVWESNLTKSVQEAGIEYTVLDDFHFRRAGLTNEQLNGYFITEDEGRILRVFPGSEQLRYLIPFSSPEETVFHCRRMAERAPGSVIVFGDDGEKFGTWPDTKEHVYQNGWLKSFFQVLTDNSDWLKTSTLAEAVDSTPPQGKIYLPDASYREMTEWALPVNRQVDYDHLVHELEHDQRWDRIKSFVSGGFWRNFKVKYPETNVMYARMMFVSGLLQRAQRENADPRLLSVAEDHLYQGQCNCPYWHGAFGGIYLPHLRNAIFSHLLKAESLIEKALGRPDQWVEATVHDYNFDGRNETRLANDKLVSWISPTGGGQVYELDLRSIHHNLGATIQRRPELYHEKVLKGENQGDGAAASIHDRVVFKQADLDQRLQYDSRLRNSLIDHFRDGDISAAAIQQNQCEEHGDFADGDYTTRIRRKPDRVQVQLVRQGVAFGIPLTITKGITLNSGSDQVEIAYLLEGLPPERTLRFGVEFNFAGLPDNQDDRYFSDADGNRLGHLGSLLDLADARLVKLSDDWLGLDVELVSEHPASIFAYPVQTVSQSEAGFELVHQSVAVEPHWEVRGDRHGRWSNRMTLSLKTERVTTNDALDTLMASSQ